ncbi:MAG: SIR2 family protein, partial [Candidatus Wukongarchaeota archaeon]|nr:SIR2 family protein [Candidatus Wukongarchaeota archaeon]
MSDSTRALASSMVSRKMSGTDSYILFLGAGASISSGCSTMMQIVDDVLKHYAKSEFDEWESKIEKATQENKKFGELLRNEIGKEKRTCFFEIWGTLDHETQYSILRPHLWDNKKPTEGYENLVKLIKKGYIKKILSTNLDNLLERALNNAGCYQPDDFIVVVNGKDRHEEIVEQLNSSRAPLKIIKLHGSLGSPKSYAFKQDEIFDFEKKIKYSLSQSINQSLIIVGYSGQDRDIDVLFEDEGKEIHFVKPSKLEPESRISQTLTVRGKGKIINGSDGEFDTFFKKLLKYVELEEGKSNASDSEPSIEVFLREIKFSDSSLYNDISNIYVPPNEYEEIQETLEKNRIVFITGTPEYGKTFTAVELMWEYFLKGYTPRWIEGEEKEQRIISRSLMLDIERELKSKHIIYFEDPFGKTKYEERESLERDIGRILDIVENFEDVYVVITSREEIFKEFEERNLSSKQLRDFEKKLNIKKPSYDNEKRKKILFNWAKAKKCEWLEDEETKKFILKKLENKETLPTPLAIRDFCISTTTKINIKEISIIVEEKSKETSKSFAREIKGMSLDKVLFLSFPFIAPFEIDFARKIFMEMTDELNLNDSNFDLILEWFKDDKIEIVANQIRYSHPSYSEALEHILINGGNVTNINIKIYSPLLRKLIEKKESIEPVIWAIASNYCILPRDVQNLLFELANKEETAECAALAILSNSKHLPKEANELLDSMCKKNKLINNVIRDILYVLNKIPKRNRDIILGEILKIKETVEFSSYVLIYNYDIISKEAQEFMLSFAEDEVKSISFLWAILHHFEIIPAHIRNEFISKMAENTGLTGEIA